MRIGAHLFREVDLSIKLKFGKALHLGLDPMSECLAPYPTLGVRVIRISRYRSPVVYCIRPSRRRLESPGDALGCRRRTDGNASLFSSSASTGE